MGSILLALSHVELLAAETMEEAQPEVSVRWDGDTCVYASGQWELRISYLLKGTRSEGQDGTLFLDGAPVEPKKEGESKDTPIGMLKHHGTERKMRWAVTGWNFADKKAIKASSAVQVTEEK